MEFKLDNESNCASFVKYLETKKVQSKNPGSNPGTVESVCFFTERFLII